jgi:hypothetical protein
MRDTQVKQILTYLLSHNTLTGLEALRLFGCFRLPARIADIKKLGLIVHKRLISVNGKRIAEYRLVE